MPQFNSGYPLIDLFYGTLFKQSFVTVPSSMEDVRASLQVEQNGPFIFSVLGVIWVQFSIIYFICFSIYLVQPQWCLWSYVGAHKHNQGFKPMCGLYLSHFLLRAMEVWWHCLLATHLFQCNKSESFCLDCMTFLSSSPVYSQAFISHIHVVYDTLHSNKQRLTNQLITATVSLVEQLWARIVKSVISAIWFLNCNIFLAQLELDSPSRCD